MQIRNSGLGFVGGGYFFNDSIHILFFCGCQRKLFAFAKNVSRQFKLPDETLAVLAHQQVETY
ncbi:hypothetical protein BI364_08320 [Acidihalobacter yilgarnensis]|uniref:Uncharacterized protein n=1 Tax=Acidihalobacter yilgarnensis TaxID=2819280 RepID=A0A1D8INC0_9GAMM|nr:hypothetical protein BI364_08320 [Acidihalobacter yilgarnensis]